MACKDAPYKYQSIISIFTAYRLPSFLNNISITLITKIWKIEEHYNIFFLIVFYLNCDLSLNHMSNWHVCRDSRKSKSKRSLSNYFSVALSLLQNNLQCTIKSLATKHAWMKIKNNATVYKWYPSCLKVRNVIWWPHLCCESFIISIVIINVNINVIAGIKAVCCLWSSHLTNSVLSIST